MTTHPPQKNKELMAKNKELIAINQQKWFVSIKKKSSFAFIEYISLPKFY